MGLFSRNKKSKSTEKNSKNSNWNKELKRNIINKTGATQQGFEFQENTVNISSKGTSRTKKGLSFNVEEITQDQIKILKNCAHENTAAELIKILNRTNKSKFKSTILKPLVSFGFFELTIPPTIKDGKEKWSTSPKLKYRLTGQFVGKKSIANI